MKSKVIERKESINNLCKEGLLNKSAWFDVRNIKVASNLEYIYKSIPNSDKYGIVIEDDQIKGIPTSVKKIKYIAGVPEDIELLCKKYDVIVLESSIIESEWYTINKSKFTKEVATTVNVVNPETLQKAVSLTHIVPMLIVEFKDETKIPLEIVLADAQNYNCKVVMRVADNIEARVVFGVLECGADGVLVSATNINSIYSITEEIKLNTECLKQDLVELTILNAYHAGMGDRACIDLTSYLNLDEGILIGSFSNGGILACSETHPLPYMKTRPFRVNAGSLQSYVLAPNNQTWYISDLRAGMEILAVSTDGKSRRATVGRVKIERRPILCIEAQAPDNTVIKVFMQEDWHVRVFGLDGQPINITTLKPGDKVIGYTMESGRHVGVKVNETILEQ